MLGPSDRPEAKFRRRVDLGGIIGRAAMRIARDVIELDMEGAKSCLGKFEVNNTQLAKFMY